MRQPYQEDVHHNNQRGVSPFLPLLLIAVPLFLLVTALTTYHTLNKIKNDSIADTQRNLEAVLHTTHAAVDLWITEKKSYVDSFVQDPNLLTLVQKQLTLPPQRDTLLNSPPLEQLRQIYAQKDSLSGFGFMLISRANINLATKYDANIGLHNLISEQRPDLLQRVFEGETVVIPPIKGDIPIQRPDGTLIPVGYPTMFIAAPIKDEQDQVIAAFAIRIDPATSFDNLIHIADHIKEMRSYAFDGSGHPYSRDSKLTQASDKTERLSQHIKQLLSRTTPINSAEGLDYVSDMEGYINQEGSHVFGGFLWNEKYSLGLATEIDTSAALKNYQRARTNTLTLFGTTAFFAALSLFITIMMMRYNSRLLEQRIQQRTVELTSANTALHITKEKLEGILTAIPDTILQVDENGTVVDANHCSEALLGYSADELIGMKVEALIPEQLREAHPNHRRQLMSPHIGPVKISRHLTARNKQGQIINVEVNINTFRIGDQWLAIVALRDISDRINAEHEREQLQLQLAQASKMKTIGQLTGGIAHDFNNMLTSIIGFAELAAHITPPGNEKLLRYMNAILQSSHRASDLVKQMLAFSRSDNGKLHELLPAPIIKEVVKMLHATLPTSITINLNLQATNAKLVGEPSQLHQAIMNLAMNAKDALGNRGTIEIGLTESQHDTRCHSCHENFSGDFIEIYVADDGPGIPATDIKQIFDPFFSTREVGQGHGMGLSIVHGIMHRCGGHILVESQAGEGTRVRLLFPLQAPLQNTAETHLPGTTERPPRNGIHHLMLVDDEKSITTFMTELFEEWGYSVSAFNSATEALMAFQQNPNEYSLVITDQTMPLMVGTELSRALLTLRAETPIILYSGYSDEVNEENYQSHGIRAFFHKPVDTSALHQTIEQILSQGDNTP